MDSPRREAWGATTSPPESTTVTSPAPILSSPTAATTETVATAATQPPDTLASPSSLAITDSQPPLLPPLSSSPIITPATATLTTSSTTTITTVPVTVQPIIVAATMPTTAMPPVVMKAQDEMTGTTTITIRGGDKDEMPDGYIAPSPFQRLPVRRPNLLYQFIKFCIGIPLCIVRVVVAVSFLLLMWLVFRICLSCVKPPRKAGDAPLPVCLSWFLRLYARFWARFCLFLWGFYWIREEGRPHMFGSPVNNARIIVCNHLSFVEGMAIMAATGCAIVGKAEIASYPFVGYIALGLQSIFVDRSNPNSKHEVVDIIRQRSTNPAFPPVLIFPEGTTTNGDFVIQFQKGVFTAALPVLPVAVRTPHRYFSPSWAETDLGLHMILQLMQMYNCMHMSYLSVYTPSSEQCRDAIAYADAVQLLIANKLNVPTSPLAFYDAPHLTELKRRRCMAHGKRDGTDDDERERWRRHARQHWIWHRHALHTPVTYHGCCPWHINNNR